MKMQGTTLTGLKKHPAVSIRDARRRPAPRNVANVLNPFLFFSFQLLPLYFCIVLGGTGAFLYTLRLATRNPDVSWLNKKESQSNDYYKDKQYKVPTVTLCLSSPTPASTRVRIQDGILFIIFECPVKNTRNSRMHIHVHILRCTHMAK